MMIVVESRKPMPPLKPSPLKLLYHRMSGIKSSVDGSIQNRTLRLVGTVYLFPPQRIETRININCHAARMLRISDVPIAKAISSRPLKYLYATEIQ